MMAPIVSMLFLAPSALLKMSTIRRLSFSTSSRRISQSEQNLISSPQSKTIQRIRKLHRRKTRIAFGETIVEGPRMVFDLLGHPNTRPYLRQIIVSTDQWDTYASRLAELCKYNDGPRIIPATPAALKVCSDTVTSQGILAIADIPKMNVLPDDAQNDDSKSPLYLVLDGVSDPGNVGTLLRSSIATGVAGVIVLAGTCDPWSPKALRSSMGGTFFLPYLESCDTWEDCHQLLTQQLHCHDDSIWAATMLENGTSTSIFDVPWVGNGDASSSSYSRAVIIGSEGQGLSDAVRETVQRTCYVPMMQNIESLNAAVCGSVILFEYLRQLQEVQKRQ